MKALLCTQKMKWHMLSRSNSVEMALKANRGSRLCTKLNENTKPVAMPVEAQGRASLYSGLILKHERCVDVSTYINPLREKKWCAVSWCPLSLDLLKCKPKRVLFNNNKALYTKNHISAVRNSDLILQGLTWANLLLEYVITLVARKHTVYVCARVCV